MAILSFGGQVDNKLLAESFVVDQNKSIAIITDDPGWHGRQLVNAFEQRGIQSIYVRLQDCHFELDREGSFLNIPGFSGLPLGVFIRGVPGGSLDQVVYYLDIFACIGGAGRTGGK